MALSNDDDDFWYSSEKRSFCFESTEVSFSITFVRFHTGRQTFLTSLFVFSLLKSDNLFGVSKSGTAQLRAGISNIQVTDKTLKYDEPQWNSKPLLSIISNETLAKGKFSRISSICKSKDLRKISIFLH
jgi:hypothetical protein